jgi:UDPglucose--hexose-1-phosphate uridylyltransferase
MEFLPVETQQQQLLCPFCIGNEEETPVPLAVYRADGSLTENLEDNVEWLVRVVPNKFPMFERPSGNSEAKKNLQDRGPYQSCDWVGEQEVIVCSPRHVTSISDLRDDELAVSFRAMQDRIARMETRSDIAHTMLFLNCRLSAGASLSHIHAQLIGSPLVSEELMGRVARNRANLARAGIALVESCAKWEAEQRVRMIYQSEHFYVFCPFASRFPFQIWLVPKHSKESFAKCPDAMLNELARSCHWLITTIEKFVEQPGYNFLLHHAPSQMSEGNHWYFEILPRLTRPAGFEWGTNIWVNPVSPETAARRLRLKA